MFPYDFTFDTRHIGFKQNVYVLLLGVALIQERINLSVKAIQKILGLGLFRLEQAESRVDVIEELDDSNQEQEEGNGIGNEFVNGVVCKKINHQTKSPR